MWIVWGLQWECFVLQRVTEMLTSRKRWQWRQKGRQSETGTWITNARVKPAEGPSPSEPLAFNNVARVHSLLTLEFPRSPSPKTSTLCSSGDGVEPGGLLPSPTAPSMSTEERGIVSDPLAGRAACSSPSWNAKVHWSIERNWDQTHDLYGAAVVE